MTSAARTFARSLWPLLVTGAVACSSPALSTGGFEETTAPAPDAGEVPLPPNPNASTPSAPTTPPPAMMDPGTADGGALLDGEAPLADGAVAASDAAPPTCSNGAVPEIEPNNDAATASAFVTSMCGVISAPGAESDFLKYQLKDTTNFMNIQFKGNVTLTFRISGQTVVWGNGKFPQIPIVNGMPYSLEVKSANGKPQNYSIVLTES